MLENANIAFSIAVATVVILLYITYNLLFRKNSFVSKETQIQASTTETGQADDQVRPVKQQKEKKQISKAVPKGKDTTFKHKLLSSCLKAHSDKVNGNLTLSKIHLIIFPINSF